MAVRGYAKWSPGNEPRFWVSKVAVVLDEYEDYWPLSCRQIFYRLVADHGFGKNEKSYNSLTQWISRARRCGMLPWEAVRDGGLGRSVDPFAHDTASEYIRWARRYAKESMMVDRQLGQPSRVELWCEAGGMMPILEDIGKPYSCKVSTGGGFDSVTAKHQLAVRTLERARLGVKTVVLHVGDFDASGESMCEVLRDDAGEMALTLVIRDLVREVKDGDDSWVDFSDETGVDPIPWDQIERLAHDGADASDVDWETVWTWSNDDWLAVERVALTGEQVVERGIETAPPKPSDSRSARFAERNSWVAAELGTTSISAQLEALTPPELDELITEEVKARLDMDAYEDRLAEEESIRAEILDRMKDI